MEDLETSYNHTITEMIYNKGLKSLESIGINLGSALSEINEIINERKAEIVIRDGLGYSDDEELRRAFSGTIDSRERVNEVIIVTRTAKDGTQNKFYFSRELHIFIKGEPEKREDGLYCRITGTNLSKL